MEQNKTASHLSSSHLLSKSILTMVRSASPTNTASSSAPIQGNAPSQGMETSPLKRNASEFNGPGLKLQKIVRSQTFQSLARFGQSDKKFQARIAWKGKLSYLKNVSEQVTKIKSHDVQASAAGFSLKYFIEKREDHTHTMFIVTSEGGPRTTSDKDDYEGVLHTLAALALVLREMPEEERKKITIYIDVNTVFKEDENKNSFTTEDGMRSLHQYVMNSGIRELKDDDGVPIYKEIKMGPPEKDESGNYKGGVCIGYDKGCGRKWHPDLKGTFTPEKDLDVPDNYEMVLVGGAATDGCNMTFHQIFSVGNGRNATNDLLTTKGVPAEIKKKLEEDGKAFYEKQGLKDEELEEAVDEYVKDRVVYCDFVSVSHHSLTIDASKTLTVEQYREYATDYFSKTEKLEGDELKETVQSHVEEMLLKNEADEEKSRKAFFEKGLAQGLKDTKDDKALTNAVEKEMEEFRKERLLKCPEDLRKELSKAQAMLISCSQNAKQNQNYFQDAVHSGAPGGFYGNRATEGASSVFDITIEEELDVLRDEIEAECKKNIALNGGGKQLKNPALYFICSTKLPAIVNVAASHLSTCKMGESKAILKRAIEFNFFSEGEPDRDELVAYLTKKEIHSEHKGLVKSSDLHYSEGFEKRLKEKDDNGNYVIPTDALVYAIAFHMKVVEEVVAYGFSGIELDEGIPLTGDGLSAIVESRGGWGLSKYLRYDTYGFLLGAFSKWTKNADQDPKYTPAAMTAYLNSVLQWGKNKEKTIYY